MLLSSLPQLISELHEVSTILGISERHNTASVSPQTEKDFFPLAFPTLYPYGRGGWFEGCGISEDEYTKYSLMKADSRFQEHPSYYFCKYQYIMQKRIGGVSALAASRTSNDIPCTGVANASAPGAHDISSTESTEQQGITVGDMRELLSQSIVEGAASLASTSVPNQVKFNRLLSRLTPFADSLPGSASYINLARRRLLTMISSPVVKDEGDFTWFSTYAMPDAFDTVIYSISKHEIGHENCYEDDNDDSEFKGSYRTALKLPLQERLDILRKSPATVARIFMLRQDAFWKCVVNGDHKPLGIYIT